MTTETPPDDWVLLEAAKRSGYSPHKDYRDLYQSMPVFTALCDMIAKHEKSPVERKLLCANRAVSAFYITGENLAEAELVVATMKDACVRAIELWEEGFGK